MSGALIVSTRTREVWTYENKRHLDRMAERLNSAEVNMALRCAADFCPDRQIRLVPSQTDPNGCILRCGCKDRHFEPRPGSGRIRRIQH